MPDLLFYVLGPDDLPACPTHGIRLVTDFFTGDDGKEYELGKCPLCKRTYTFSMDELERDPNQKEDEDQYPEER